MRESTRPDAEKVAVTAALIELAAATRDTTIDAGVLRVYMPHLDSYSVAEVKDACEALQTADWFPKVGELLTACASAKHRAYASNWFEDCQRLHDGRCGGQYKHGNRMQIDAAKAEQVSA